MTSVQVDILNPKAERLLKNLADLKLIAIKKTSKSDFSNVVTRLRKKVKKAPSLAQITKEVESVRSNRYGR